MIQNKSSQVVLLMILTLMLSGCSSLYKQNSLVSQRNCFDVIIPEINLTNATMAEAIEIVHQTWVQSLEGDIPSVVWSEYPGCRITMKARNISAGRYLSMLAAFSSCKLKVESTGFVFTLPPRYVDDDYQASLIHFSQKVLDALAITKETSPSEFQGKLKLYGVCLKVVFLDSSEKMVVVTGFPEHIVALKGMQTLLDADVRLVPGGNSVTH
jgi:hypothetical protein